MSNTEMSDPGSNEDLVKRIEAMPRAEMLGREGVELLLEQLSRCSRKHIDLSISVRKTFEGLQAGRSMIRCLHDRDMFIRLHVESIQHDVEWGRWTVSLLPGDGASSSKLSSGSTFDEAIDRAMNGDFE